MSVMKQFSMLTYMMQQSMHFNDAPCSNAQGCLDILGHDQVLSQGSKFHVSRTHSHKVQLTHSKIRTASTALDANPTASFSAPRPLFLALTRPAPGLQ